MNYNVWSCGDYQNSTTGFVSYGSGNFSITSEYVNTGEKSLCISNVPDNGASIYTNYNIESTDVGKSFEFKCKIFNPNEGTIQMIVMTSQGNLRYVTIPKNDSFVELSSTSLVIPESSYVRCAFYISASTYVNKIYIDDLSLIIQ